MAKADLTAERLRELFHYEPETGLFTRRCDVFSSRNVCYGRSGDQIGRSTSRNGYRCCAIDERTYYLHRLAWLYVHGAWPKGVIDHINRDRLDNRLENLRDTSQSVNMQNVIRTRKNSTGFAGVHLHDTSKLWRAQIKAFGKKYELGYFATPEEGQEAYLQAKRRLHAGCPI